MAILVLLPCPTILTDHRASSWAAVHRTSNTPPTSQSPPQPQASSIERYQKLKIPLQEDRHHQDYQQYLQDLLETLSKRVHTDTLACNRQRVCLRCAHFLEQPRHHHQAQLQGFSRRNSSHLQPSRRCRTRVRTRLMTTMKLNRQPLSSHCNTTTRIELISCHSCRLTRSLQASD